MKVNKQCKECGKDFLADSREVKRGNAQFCSRSCVRIHDNKNRERVEKVPNCTCEQCNVSFYRVKSKQETKSGMSFCSRACKEEYQRQTITYSKNYRRTVRLLKGIEKCERCGYNEYPEILQVHHKDRNRENNVIENLEVLCPNCHESEHKRGISVNGCTLALQA